MYSYGINMVEVATVMCHSPWIILSHISLTCQLSKMQYLKSFSKGRVQYTFSTVLLYLILKTVFLATANFG